jgi:diketogulonate reductase-like aldo/keto reductase
MGIAAAIASGLAKREEIFVTSKLWNDDHRPDRVLPALRQTLRDLQLDYLVTTESSLPNRNRTISAACPDDVVWRYLVGSLSHPLAHSLPQELGQSCRAGHRRLTSSHVGRT